MYVTEACLQVVCYMIKQLYYIPKTILSKHIISHLLMNQHTQK